MSRYQGPHFCILLKAYKVASYLRKSTGFIYNLNFISVNVGLGVEELEKSNPVKLRDQNKEDCIKDK